MKGMAKWILELAWTAQPKVNLNIKIKNVNLI
jgi:hypothetical protein